MSLLKKDVLILYRNLLRYGQKIELTDKEYFKTRIRKEFELNKKIENSEDIKFHMQRSPIFRNKESNMISSSIMKPGLTRLPCIISLPMAGDRYQKYIAPLGKLFIPLSITCKFKHSIDKSKVPTLNEDDLEEHFVRGSGPGGSNVNKNTNCAVVIHKPTGIVIKCHQSRLLDTNRQIARNLLINKLDEEYNGHLSVASQKRAILDKKSHEKERKRKKLELLKQAWKQKEGID